MDKRFNRISDADSYLARETLYRWFENTPGAPISEVLSRIRGDLCITRAELAKYTGVSARHLADIERGTGNPSLRTLEKILTRFGLEVGVRLKATPKR